MTEELSGGGPCALCGRDPAAGYAMIGDDWYCHGDHDSEPTCYMRSQSRMLPAFAIVSHPGASGALELADDLVIEAEARARRDGAYAGERMTLEELVAELQARDAA